MAPAANLVATVPEGLEVLADLGSGMHTAVYRVRRGAEEYALKFIQAPGADFAARVTFRRETAIQATVEHPGIVRLFEVGQVGARPYLVEELVTAPTLADEMADGPVPEARIAAIAAAAAEALDAAHQAGLAHRDVKPGNVALVGDAVKLLDFGIAGRAGVADPHADAITYWAPEQLGMLRRVADGRSDLYSLGAVMFHAVSELPPFATSDARELMRMHTVMPAPDVRALRPDVSPEFAAILAKLLAKDPDERYQTGAALAADLRAGAGVSAAWSTPLEFAEAPFVGRLPEVAALAESWQRARGGQGGIAIVAGAAGGGKSRLVREVYSVATAAGGLVLHGVSPADDLLPLAPIREAVEDYIRGFARLSVPERAAAVQRVRDAAGQGASLLRTLSPDVAELLPGPELADEDRQDQFAVAVASFLLELARGAGGAILHLDDVQWLDAGTRRVLHHLSPELPTSKLLVVATCRADAAGRAAYDAFCSEFAQVIGLRLGLAALSDTAAAALVAVHLRGATVPCALTEYVVSRGNGNPFAIDEYVRTVLDRGLLRPSWSEWTIEEGGVETLALPEDVLDLVRARVAALGHDIRQLLVAAAGIGIRFRPDDLAHIVDLEEREVAEALRVCTERRLVAASGDRHHRFRHDRVREALLAELAPAELPELHLRIARGLQAAGAADTERVYAIGYHYRHTRLDRVAADAFGACVTAGHRALADHSPMRTKAFLETALEAAELAEITPDGRFFTAYGTSLLRSGQFDRARAQFELALGTEVEPNRRAMLHALICEAYHSAWNVPGSVSSARIALVELGSPLPRNPIWLVLTTIVRLVAAFAVAMTGIGRGTASGVRRERFRLEAVVMAIGAQGAASGRQMLLLSCLTLRQLYAVSRIGPSPEYVHAHANLVGVAEVMGLRGLAERRSRRLADTAQRLGDPRLVAYAAWVAGITQSVVRNSDVDAGEVMRRTINDHGRWLHAQEYLNAGAVLCNRLLYGGFVDEARSWYERSRSHVAYAELGPEHPFMLVDAQIRSFAGAQDEVEQLFGDAHAALTAIGENRERILYYHAARLAALHELGAWDHRFDATANELATLRFKPRSTWPAQHVIWAYLAYGRIAQARAAAPAERSARLADARRALSGLRTACSSPLVRVHLLIAKALYATLTGGDERALDLCERASREAAGTDAPTLFFEIGRARAFALRNLGRDVAAITDAREAITLAVSRGWGHRAAALRAEFGIAAAAGEPRSDLQASRPINGQVNAT